MVPLLLWHVDRRQVVCPWLRRRPEALVPKVSNHKQENKHNEECESVENKVGPESGFDIVVGLQVTDVADAPLNQYPRGMYKIENSRDEVDGHALECMNVVRMAADSTIRWSIGV